MCMATLSSSSISNLSRFTGCTSLQWAQKNPTRPYPGSFNVLSDPDPDHKLHATGEGSDCRATVSPRACAVSLQQFYPRVLVYIILTFKYIKKRPIFLCIVEYSGEYCFVARINKTSAGYTNLFPRFTILWPRCNLLNQNEGGK